jgi:galactonate dehydratase
MRITEVKALVSAPPRCFVYAKVTTSDGLVGYGEAQTDGAPEVHAAAINTIGKHVVGLDPMNTEKAYATMHRSQFGWPPEATMRAIGAIDGALFDIKGKALKTPVYNLLGGKMRDKIQLYCHIVTRPGEKVTPESLAEGAKRQVKLGFGALKFDPFSTVYRQETGEEENGCIYVPQGMNYPRKLAAKAIEMVKAVREAVGPEVYIMTDIHGRFDVESAIRIGRQMEPYDLFFYEEPIPVTNDELLSYVRRSVRVPICVGERRYTPEDFRRLFEQEATDIIMPDHSRNGGITWLKKIADMAATYYIPVAPHVVVSSPLNAVISAHTMTSVPNFLIHESMGPQRLEILKDFLKPQFLPEDGYFRVPDRPGLGVELNEEILDEEIDETELLNKMLT